MLSHRPVLAAVSLLLAASQPLAAQAGDPTRAETVQFIADKINQQGVVNVASYVHDNATNKDSITRESWEQTRFQIDPHKKCQMTYHKKITIDGHVTVDSDFWAVLRGADRVEVLPMEQVWKRADSRAGNTTLAYKADPKVTVVRLNEHDGTYYDFAFYEEDMANRVAKALEHAVDFCGGGKEAF